PFALAFGQAARRQQAWTREAARTPRPRQAAAGAGPSSPLPSGAGGAARPSAGALPSLPPRRPPAVRLPSSALRGGALAPASAGAAAGPSSLGAGRHRLPARGDRLGHRGARDPRALEP